MSNIFDEMSNIYYIQAPTYSRRIEPSSIFIKLIQRVM